MKKLAEVFSIRSNSTSYFVFSFSLFIQFLLIGKHMDNSILSAYVVGAVDASDYASRALIWQAEGFSQAFKDAYRMPGYPAIILLFTYLFPGAPFLGVRLLQMFCLAFSVVMVKKVVEKYVSLNAAVFASLIYSLIPVWHFTPILLAESLNSFIVVSLIFILSSIDSSKLSRKKTVSLSLLIASAIYLKPNNLMLLIIVAAFLFFMFKTNRLANLRNISVLVFLLICPWLYFVQNSQPGFVGLTTNSGINLYIGTGMATSYDESFLSNSAIKWQVDSRNNPKDVLDIAMDGTPLYKNRVFTNRSMDIWKSRPLRELGYGFDKSLFAFGLKSQSLMDKTFGIFTFVSIFSAFMTIWRPKVRAWGSTLLLVTMILTLQATFFQADRRFVIPIFFPFAVICLGILIGNIKSVQITVKRMLRRH